MHIPEGMLNQTTTIGSWIASVPFLAYSISVVRRKMSDSRLVLMAVLASLIFALQMLNFPVAGGTSGHFAGGAAAAIILGPWAAILILTTVLIIQAFMFADGGVLALGANMLNIAVIAPLVGWGVYSLVTRVRSSRGGRMVGSFVAAWAATVTAAAGAGILLWLSGRAPFAISVGSMTFWHSLIGIGEGLITATLIGYILSVRPDILEAPERTTSTRGLALGLGVFAVLAAGISFLASANPDGLEYVYGRIATPIGESKVLASPFSDYLVPGIENQTLAGILAGIVGLVIAGVALYAIMAGTRSKPPKP